MLNKREKSLYNFKIIIYCSGVLLCYVILSCATLIQTILDTTWPLSHERDAFLFRTYIYVQHFKQGDFFPIWAASDNWGYGSPLPILYHKLFYYFAAILYIVFKSYKLAFVLSTVLLLVVGAVGIYQVCRYIGSSPFASFCGGGMLIVANYTVTNWLIRAAFAEFSAAMIFPWMFLAFLEALQKKQITVKLFCITVVMILAHSVLAYYAILLLAVVGVVFAFLTRTISEFLSPRTWYVPILLSLFSLVFLCVVYLPAVILGRDYDISRILSEPYQPRWQIKPFIQYFWDSAWNWGITETSYTVQLDWAPLFFSVVGLIILFWPSWLWPKTKFLLRPLNRGACFLLFLMAFILFLGIFLQTHWSLLFYENVPGAAYIQFPWRLLAFITPLMIVFSLTLITLPQFRNMRRYENICAGASLLMMIVNCGAFTRIHYDSLKQIELPDGTAQGMSFSYAKEYVPKNAGFKKLVNPFCQVTRTSLQSEQISVDFIVRCTKTSVVSFEIYKSLGHRVEINGIQKPCEMNLEYPALCSVTVPEGQTDVLIHMPTYKKFIAAIWYQIFDGKSKRQQ